MTTLDHTDTGGAPAFLKKPTKPLIYTYTILNTYRNVCPHQMFRRYIKKDQPYIETPEMKWGNDVHTAFEYRLAAGRRLPDGMQKWEQFAAPFDRYRNRRADGIHLACEQKLGVTKEGKPCDYWADNVWLRGKLDLTLLRADDGYMADWKSGGSKYEDPFELEVGAVLLKIHNRHLTSIVGNYVWLKEDRSGQLYDLTAFRKTWDEIHRLAGLIEADKDRGEFNKKQSGLCGWCSVEDCENWRPRK